MIIFPAVDIQNGQAVRLKQGQADQATIFGEDPCEVALKWQELGAQYLHVVDLDGAFKGEARNYPLIKAICEKLSIPVQIGGGIRDEATIKRYLDCGVTRLILGTIGLENPDLFNRLCAKFPGQIGISLDADQGVLKTRGWVESSNLTLKEVLPQIIEAKASFIIYTDISRDGMQTGVNLEHLTWLCEHSPLPVIAAGGVATLKDIQDLYPLSQNSNLEGVISGRALYTKTLDLKEANDWIEAQKA
ncbi:MAG: 1-(5-phosphoribosyl)-5-[Desulfovibrionaceae bacterium]|nr:1-(5-phosphoribosyl)-5-[(5-phosphoribosylamino)methylideneamino]imidazole-4-carboxamide isomerase [Desulfovibrionaceae bacterium]